MTHPDIASEQSYLDNAYRQGERMRDRAADYAGRDDPDRLPTWRPTGGELDDAILRAHFAQRARSLSNALQGVICFGRIDEPSERYYIGSTHIEDETGTPLVIDWRAPVAIPFYRATVSNPMDLLARRRFIVEGRTLIDILEEDFDDPESGAVGGGLPDPLLAELGRSRTGRMRDIVATIQAEQDEIIRAGIAECLIVQGGPGTGKTAVALHRAAFLLFEHRERLTREGVLVLGPNRLFLDYISQVLPTLGERSVTQSTVEGLLSRYRVEATDSPKAAMVKGDARMAEVIRNAAWAAIRPATSDLAIPYRTRIVSIEAKEIDELVNVAAEGNAPWSVRRQRFRNSLIRLAHQRLPEAMRWETDIDEFAKDVLRGPGRRRIDSVWKTTNPVGLVRRVLTSRRTLTRAAAGILSREEMDAIVRKPVKKGEPEPWTRFDLPLIDEAEAFVKGRTVRYGHIVLDEAQDRTPMELRLIGRRSTNGSLTMLGDLAQATNPASISDWTAVAAHLAVPVAPRLVELTVGYRVPGAVLDFANRLLRAAAPGVTPTRAVQKGGDPPAVHRHSSVEALLGQLGELTEAFVSRYSTTAVICPGSLAERITDRLELHGLSLATDLSISLNTDVAVLSPVAAKGLEFDAVIVVEPIAIVKEELGGARALFVALTRAVQHLSVVHVAELPALLR